MAFSLSARNSGKMNLLPTSSRSLIISSLPKYDRARCNATASSPSCHFHSRTFDNITSKSPQHQHHIMTPHPHSDTSVVNPHTFQQQRRRNHRSVFQPTQPTYQNTILKPGQRITIDPSGIGNNHNSNNPNQKSRKRQKIRAAPAPFVDRIHLKTRGGHGGKGCLAYHSLGAYKRRACGGHGGRGGNVYLVTDPALSSLKMERHHYNGQDGVRGGRNGRHGKNGRDVYVRVPCGVVVRRVLDYGEDMDELDDGDEHMDDEEDEEVEDGELGAHHEDEDEDYDESESDGHLTAASHVLDDDENDNEEIDASNHDENDETINDDEEEEEDFDTYYERISQTKKQQRRNQRRSGGRPSDYDEVVDTGLRAEDGMFYWTAPETPTEDEILSNTAYPMHRHRRHPSTRQTAFVADLDQPHSSLLVASGGRPGVGNMAYANRPHTSGIGTHMSKKAVPGEGECSYLELELKLIADVGLVGFPNAGKSSLLSAMSRARPRVASYPFTTLHPLVGSIRYRDGHSIVMADVPGLIDGAAEGRGRGIEFLRHIERTKALAYVVDAAGVDGRDPVSDLRILGKELREYGSSGIFGGEDEAGDDDDGEHGEETRRRRREIMNRPSLILANKMDLIPEADAGLGRREELLFRLGLAAEEVGIAVCEDDGILGISAGVTGEGLRVLSKRLRRVVKEVE